jgi:hypothetical protein
MLTNDARAVRHRLEALELRIQTILAMYDRDGTIPPDRRAVVRSSYERLKLNVRAAFKTGDSREGRLLMSAAERRFYQPAIQAASSHLVANVASSPSALYQSLCDALSDISDAVVRLDENERGAETT